MTNVSIDGIMFTGQFFKASFNFPSNTHVSANIQENLSSAVNCSKHGVRPVLTAPEDTHLKYIINLSYYFLL